MEAFLFKYSRPEISCHTNNLKKWKDKNHQVRGAAKEITV